MSTNTGRTVRMTTSLDVLTGLESKVIVESVNEDTWMTERRFWSSGRRKLVARAFMNLFQALAIGLFVTETYFKASVIWKVTFLLVMGLSFLSSIIVWPSDDDAEGGT
jgi:hypothetical protein